jgi:flavin-dependent dehydrogenase
MLHRAEELGVEFRWKTSVRALHDTEVETEEGRFRGHWLVAADGRLSRLRTMAGIATSVPTRQRFGVRRHYQRAPWTDTVEVYWADECEAYVTPVGPEMVGVAVLSRTRPLVFDHQIQRFPTLVHRLVGAPIASRDRGAGPFGHRPSTVVRDRLALVGDASGSLDPITGEGVSVAIGQARALVRAISKGSISDYAADHRRIMRLPRLITELLLVAERRPRLRRWTIRVFAASPRLFSRLVNVIGRS